MYDYDDSWYYQDEKETYEGDYNPLFNPLIDEVSNRCDFGRQIYIFDVTY